MRIFVTFFFSFSIILLSGFSTFTTSAQQFEFPANQDKSFISEDEFYQKLNKEKFKEYEEYENASYSIRRKIPYKDTPDAVMNFEKKTGRCFGQPKGKLAKNIHPERQVYFFASFYQTNKNENHKYIVIDAETKNFIHGGNSEHTYENPYE